jgi:hypothetical protein
MPSTSAAWSLQEVDLVVPTSDLVVVVVVLRQAHFQ